MHASVQLVVFLLIVMGPVPTAYASVRGCGSRAERWLLGLMQWVASQAFLGIVLGACHLFTWTAVIIAESALLGFGICLGPRMAVTWGADCSATPQLPCSEPLTLLEKLLLACAGLVTTWLILTSFATPITDYDSLSYHLPMMVHWFQTGTLANLDYWKGNTLYGYPYGWEVICALFLFPFHADQAVVLPQLVAWAMLGLSIVCLTRELGGAREQSLAGALVVMFLPIVTEMLNSLHVDIPLAAFFTTSLFLAIRYGRKSSPTVAVYLLFAISLMIGVKMTGIVYGAFSLLRVALGWLPRPGAEPSRSADMGTERVPTWLANTGAERSCWRLLALTAPLIVVVGAFYYVRNIITVHNPLGNIAVSILGVTIFPGDVTSADLRATSLARLFSFHRASDIRVLVTQLLLHLRLPYFVLLGMPALSCWNWRELTRVLGRLDMLFITFTAAICLLLYWISPYTADDGSHGGRITQWISVEFRYALPGLSLMAVIAAVVISGQRWMAWGTAVIAIWAMAYAALAATVVFPHWERFFLLHLLGLGILGGVLSWLSLVLWMRDLTRGADREIHSTSGTMRRCLVAVSIATILVIGCACSRSLLYLRDMARYVAYGPAELYLRGAGDSPIAYNFSQSSYPLLGADLSRRVVWDPPRAGEGPWKWARRLRAEGFSLLAMGLGPCPSRDLAWLNMPDGPFRRVCGHDPHTQIVLYEVSPWRKSHDGAAAAIRSAPGGGSPGVKRR